MQTRAHAPATDARDCSKDGAHVEKLANAAHDICSELGQRECRRGIDGQDESVRMHQRSKQQQLVARTASDNRQQASSQRWLLGIRGLQLKRAQQDALQRLCDAQTNSERDEPKSIPPHADNANVFSSLRVGD